MQIHCTYDTEKDVWCLLNKGKSSSNSSNPTNQYVMLVEKYGKDPTIENAKDFIQHYIASQDIDVPAHIHHVQKDWETISAEYHRRAESIFDTKLNNDVTVYFTINGRCPYSIPGNLFYVHLGSNDIRKTIMHELWHFYTWYGIGEDQEETCGPEKYNALKESLTILLNVECKDLLPQDVRDMGYPQHQAIRAAILEYWKKDRNIHRLWTHMIEHMDHIS